VTALVQFATEMSADEAVAAEYQYLHTPFEARVRYKNGAQRVRGGEVSNIARYSRT
jgi:hypothetical protein